MTIHGMAYTQQPGTALLVQAFLAALNAGLAMQRAISSSVTQAVELKVPGVDFIREVNGRAKSDLGTDQLFEILHSEPATWRGITMNGGQWLWDLTDVRLSRYAALQDGRGYLARLEEFVGIPAIAPSAEALPPMALPDALDHLDLAWRLVTRQHLVQVPRAAIAAKLTQPVASVEEFESRCSALADLLNALNLPKPATLQNVKAKLGELLADRASRSQAAVDTLRQVVAIRAGQQHQGADTRAAEASVTLGLAAFTDNWEGAWNHLRAVTMQALNTIREEIGSLDYPQ